MTRRHYSTDLTDAQWALLEPFFPPVTRADGRTGRPRTYSYREILNGILYVVRTGCIWELLPHDLPGHHTCYHYFRKWSRNGLWQKVQDALRDQVRQQLGRDPSPSAAIVDSQSTKTTEKGGRKTPTISATTQAKRSKDANATCS